MLRDKLNEICARPESENYKTLPREITENQSKRKGELYSRISEQSAQHVSPNRSVDSNQPVKDEQAVFVQIHRPILKFLGKHDGCVIAKIILKKNEFRRHIKTDYKATITVTEWC